MFLLKVTVHGDETRGGAMDGNEGGGFTPASVENEGEVAEH